MIEGGGVPATTDILYKGFLFQKEYQALHDK